MSSGGSGFPRLLHKRGIASLVSFMPDGLIYRRWHGRVGHQDLRLKLDSD